MRLPTAPGPHTHTHADTLDPPAPNRKPSYQTSPAQLAHSSQAGYRLPPSAHSVLLHPYPAHPFAPSPPPRRRSCGPCPSTCSTARYPPPRSSRSGNPGPHPPRTPVPILGRPPSPGARNHARPTTVTGGAGQAPRPRFEPAPPIARCTQSRADGRSPGVSADLPQLHTQSGVFPLSSQLSKGILGLGSASEPGGRHRKTAMDCGGRAPARAHGGAQWRTTAPSTGVNGARGKDAGQQFPWQGRGATILVRLWACARQSRNLAARAASAGASGKRRRALRAERARESLRVRCDRHRVRSKSKPISPGRSVAPTPLSRAGQDLLRAGLEAVAGALRRGRHPRGPHGAAPLRAPAQRRPGAPRPPAAPRGPRRRVPRPHRHAALDHAPRPVSCSLSRSLSPSLLPFLCV